jgi:hypothetical protein
VPASAGLLASGKKALVVALAGLTLLGGLGLLGQGGGGEGSQGNANDRGAVGGQSLTAGLLAAQPAPPAAAVLAGVVLDPDGQPVPGARVAVSPEGDPMRAPVGEGATPG